MELSLLVAQIYSAILLISGVSLIVRTKEWMAYVEEIKQRESGLLLIGLMILPFGLFMVLTHSIWAWSPVVIVTIMGWILFIDAILLLLFPQLYRMLNFSEGFLYKACMIKGIVLALIGGYLSYYLFFGG